MNRNLTALLLVALALVANVAVLSGPVAADHAGNDSAELHNVTYGVEDGDQSVWVDVTNTTHNGVVEPVHVTIYGVDNGTETQVNAVNLSAAAGETVGHTEDVNVTAYDEYKLVVEGYEAETIDSGLITKYSGAGGFGFNSQVFGFPAWLVALAAVAVGLYFKED